MQMLNQTFPLPNSNEIYMLPLGSFTTLFEMSDFLKNVSDTVISLVQSLSGVRLFATP